MTMTSVVLLKNKILKSIALTVVFCLLILMLLFKISGNILNLFYKDKHLEYPNNLFDGLDK